MSRKQRIELLLNQQHLPLQLTVLMNPIIIKSCKCRKHFKIIAVSDQFLDLSLLPDTD